MTIINPNILVQPGARFGRLVVVKLAPPVKDRRQEVYCDCDCGSRMVLLRANNVRAGMTQSCGCLARERSSAHNRRHGESRPPPAVVRRVIAVVVYAINGAFGRRPSAHVGEEVLEGLPSLADVHNHPASGVTLSRWA